MNWDNIGVISNLNFRELNIIAIFFKERFFRFLIPLGIFWYKIDQNKNIKRRLLYYVNFFLILTISVYTIFVARGEWVPIPIVFILIYALAALVLILIRRPLSTRFIALWTSFLVYLFFVTLLYMGMIEPTEFLLQNLTIGVFLILVVIGSVLDYAFRK